MPFPPPPADPFKAADTPAATSASAAGLAAEAAAAQPEALALQPAAEAAPTAGYAAYQFWASADGKESTPGVFVYYGMQ